MFSQTSFCAEDSSTTKLRVVFDASSKTTTGVSLNECLIVGPKVQEDLFDILLRFRFFKVAISPDIAKMYRQVELRKKDKDYQCIFSTGRNQSLPTG